MALTVDQANIGTSVGTAQQNNAFNTTADVAAGAMIVIEAHRFRSGGTGVYTGTGGGLTWTTVATSSSGNILVCLACAFAPAGLASGTSIGINGSVNNNDYTIVAASYLGVDTSGTVTAAVRATNTGAAGTAAWSTGTIAGSAGDGYIGGAGGDGSLRTSTPASTNGTTPGEQIDFNSGTSSGSVTLVSKLSGAASDSLAGTWSGTLTHVTVGAAFILAGGAAEVPPPNLMLAPYQGAF